MRETEEKEIKGLHLSVQSTCCLLFLQDRRWRRFLQDQRRDRQDYKKKCGFRKYNTTYPLAIILKADELIPIDKNIVGIHLYRNHRIEQNQYCHQDMVW